MWRLLIKAANNQKAEWNDRGRGSPSPRVIAKVVVCDHGYLWDSVTAALTEMMGQKTVQQRDSWITFECLLFVCVCQPITWNWFIESCDISRQNVSLDLAKLHCSILYRYGEWNYLCLVAYNIPDVYLWPNLFAPSHASACEGSSVAPVSKLVYLWCLQIDLTDAVNCIWSQRVRGQGEWRKVTIGTDPGNIRTWGINIGVRKPLWCIKLCD